MTARRKFTDAQRRARLATRHRLLPATRTDDVATIANSVVALHSTDPATVYLSAMARMKHPSIEAVSKALYDDRTVVRHHAMRRTLWVLTPQMARWAHAACTVAVATKQGKRLAKMVEDSGLATDGAAWAKVARAETLAALTSLGTATARQVGRAVPQLTTKLHLKVGGADVAVGGAHTRLLLNLGFDGAIVRGRPSGSWINSEYPWSVAEEWIPGGLTGEDVDTGAAELARNYLARFGPASTADLQWWAGWTAGTTKRALAAIDAVEVDLDDASGGGVGWVLPDDTGDEVSKPWIAFLPALDSTTMGWKNRVWYLGDLAKFGSPVFDTNGNAGPTIWVDGRVVGGWAQRKSGEIAFKLLADLPAKRVTSISAEAERLRDLIGEARVNVRFPAPMQKELLA
ncbi:MAG TPA: winged helix DNA-binding domain-containing protein [Ilumatobacteraceae bacterium]|nr:winged helix DNA-binding domain-containing protein [Ilumatobacteraceae bacterium]